MKKEEKRSEKAVVDAKTARDVHMKEIFQMSRMLKHRAGKHTSKKTFLNNNFKLFLNNLHFSFKKI